MRTPLVVVTGVDPVAMDTTVMSLAWDLPRAVSVRHHLDPHAQLLTRTVSDVSGVLEHEQVRLEHACVSCALREDVLPTLERLARDGRWDSILCRLPTGAEADQLVAVLAGDTRLARHLSLRCVLAAVAGSDVAGDMLGDALLRERDLHSHPGDARGVGEVGCSQLELADLVVLDADPGPDGADLVRALARPEVALVTGAAQLDPTRVVAHRRRPEAAPSWRDLEHVPRLVAGRAWRLDLASARPFHPGRLLEQVERLGGGAFRSRGSFWLPTRPGERLDWAGAGGQLSIGRHGPWGRRTPGTRLLLTGLGEAPGELARAFEELLLTPAEARLDPRHWAVGEDGFEPWLGEVPDAA